MLCSNLVENLRNIVIVALVIVSYASNVLSRSDQITKNAIEPEKSSNNATIMKKVPFVEYYIEHNISQGDAKRSFLETGIKLLDGMCFCYCSHACFSCHSFPWLFDFTKQEQFN